MELSKSELGVITYNQNCKKYTVTYTNATFCFNHTELLNFQKVLLSFSNKDFCFNIMNQSKAIIKAKHSNMGLSVSRFDIENLNRLIEEAKMMVEINQLLLTRS